MKDLEKVNANQLYAYWKNFSIGLSVLVVTMLLSKIFPPYFSPIIGLLAAAFLYTTLYNNKIKNTGTCMMFSYTVFYCVIAYSFISIIINILDIWGIIYIPKEISFFNDPYILSLLLDPICFIVTLIIYLRGSRLKICIDCKISHGISIERGKLGEILTIESRKLLVTMIFVFGFLSVLCWVYYFGWYYQNALVNNRDWYVFLWLNIIALLFVELYFSSRYYNIYLDLKENGEIITEAELSDMSAKTYLRYYLICGDKVFLNPRVADKNNPGRFYIDTPFVTKRNVNGITTAEVLSTIQRMSGVKDGELRFFYGRKSLDIAKHRLMRYFYFLNGGVEQYGNIDIAGEWIDFQRIKKVYTDRPNMMSLTLLTDISRMVTIVFTQKLFDERGFRKMKIKSYQPTLDLVEVREKNYDFQDDKWIRISMYNSDIRSFRIKRWWNRLLGRNNPKESTEWRQNP